MRNPIKKTFSVIMVVSICLLISFSVIYPVSAASTLVRAEVSASQLHIGDKLAVSIKISNAQDIFGVDVTLNWNSAVLQLETASSQLGVESHSGGVLHESAAYPIEVVDNSASQSTAKYHLSATSTGSSTPAFSGNGTIAIVTFKVINTGTTGFSLQDVELSQLDVDGTADLITPSTTVDPVNAAVPEFPLILILIVILVAVTAIALFSDKLSKSRNKINFKKATTY